MGKETLDVLSPVLPLAVDPEHDLGGSRAGSGEPRYGGFARRLPRASSQASENSRVLLPSAKLRAPDPALETSQHAREPSLPGLVAESERAGDPVGQLAPGDVGEL